MPELPYPATTLARLTCQVAAVTRAVMIPYSDRLLMQSGRDDTQGVEPPSLKIGVYGFFPFRLAVKAGSVTVSARVLQPRADAQRPFMRVRRNPAIGLANDITATAGTSTTWQDLSLAFTASAGAIILELWNADDAWPCWFDEVILK